MDDIGFARATVKTASTMLTEHFHDDHEVDRKARHDFVTEVDVAVEEAMIDVLDDSDHAVYGEETGKHPGDDKTWIVDPLDGTTNYILGNPSFATMVALVDEGTVEVSAIAVPFTDDIFTAVRGDGAYRNGEEIGVSDSDDIHDSFLLFCHGKRPEDATAAIDVYSRFKEEVNDLRQIGSAGIEFATVAAGRADGFIFPGAPDYDVAAGKLLVQEAGGTVSSFDGEPWHATDSGLVASNGRLHERIRSAVSLD